jgi:predicted nucleic acid-binding protein
LLRDGAPLALTDLIFTEILQGLRSEREASLVEKHIRRFPIFRLSDLDDFASAASLYRRARKRGVTITSGIDCLIAAVCIRENAPILHADDDFDRLATCTPLRIFA